VIRTLLLSIFTAALGLSTVAHAGDTIRIGTTQSLSGHYQAFGTEQLRGLQMWVADVNARGALLGQPVELVHYDDGSRSKRSTAGFTKLIEEDKVVIAPAGTAALVVAFDKATGKELWRTPNPEGWLLSHASLMPAKLGGVDQYLFSVLQGTIGISAADGKLLWHHPFKFNISVSPSPLVIDGERVYITAAYDSGGAMFRVKRDGDKFTTEEIFGHGANEWNSEVQTPIQFKDHMFAVGKKKRGLFTCMDYDGKPAWTSDGKAYFGLGSFILADGMWFILEGKTGMLRLLEASTEGYKELASAQILGGHDVWGPPALSDGKLVIRDFGRMVCLKVK